MSTTRAYAVSEEERPVLSWQVHLARRQPKKLAVVIAVGAAAATLAYVWFASWVPAAAMLLALFGAISDFLLPVTYTLTSTHAEARTPAGKRIMSWKDVRNWYVDESGVKLSPLSRPSRLEAYRGVYLRFGDRRDEVMEAVWRLKPGDA